jgi:hypothetical protein
MVVGKMKGPGMCAPSFIIAMLLSPLPPYTDGGTSSGPILHVGRLDFVQFFGLVADNRPFVAFPYQTISEQTVISRLGEPVAYTRCLKCGIALHYDNVIVRFVPTGTPRLLDTRIPSEIRVEPRSPVRKRCE